MKRMPICVALAALLLFGLSGCAKAPEASVAQATPETTIKERLLAGVNGLAPSEQLCFEDGLTITGMGSISQATSPNGTTTSSGRPSSG